MPYTCIGHRVDIVNCVNIDLCTHVLKAGNLIRYLMVSQGVVDNNCQCQCTSDESDFLGNAFTGLGIM